MCNSTQGDLYLGKLTELYFFFLAPFRFLISCPFGFERGGVFLAMKLALSGCWEIHKSESTSL